MAYWKTSWKIKLIKRRLFLKQEDFQTSFSNSPMKKPRNIRKLKVMKRRLYKVKEDVLEEQKSIRKRKVSCKISKRKKQTRVFQKMKVTVTPLEKVKSSKEKLNSYPLLESNKKQKDQKSFKLQSTQCGVCEKCNCRNCGQCWNCQNMTKFGGSG